MFGENWPVVKGYGSVEIVKLCGIDRPDHCSRF